MARSVCIDLRPYMNRTPFTVRKDCAASRAHQAFISLGLRHLLVVDNRNNVVGVITRKDLDHAAGAQAGPQADGTVFLLAMNVVWIKSVVVVVCKRNRSSKLLDPFFPFSGAMAVADRPACVQIDDQFALPFSLCTPQTKHRGFPVLLLFTSIDLWRLCPAGHGWWRVAAPAPKPQVNFVQQLLAGSVFHRPRGNVSIASEDPLMPGDQLSRPESALLRDTEISSTGHHR